MRKKRRKRDNKLFDPVKKHKIKFIQLFINKNNDILVSIGSINGRAGITCIAYSTTEHSLTSLNQDGAQKKTSAFCQLGQTNGSTRIRPATWREIKSSNFDDRFGAVESVGVSSFDDRVPDWPRATRSCTTCWLNAPEWGNRLLLRVDPFAYFSLGSSWHNITCLLVLHRLTSDEIWSQSNR